MIAKVEVLKPVFADSWAAATPAIGNANPKGALSWAAFLSDYGRWSTGLPSGEIQEAPPHNAAYRRSVLLELGDRLQFALGLGDELPCWMRAHGHRIYFEPAAQIDHANVNRVSHWMRERFVAGWVIAAHRAQRWTVARRLFIGGSVFIPPLLVWRVLPGVWQNLRRKEVPLTAVPAIMLAAIVKTVGEVCGYAGITATQAERHMHEYEMHKLAYLAHSRACSSKRRTIRFGVIGCGVIAFWAHLRELRRLKNATLIAASDPDAGARERAIRLTGVPVYEHSSEVLQRSDVDAIVICAPTHLHAELAVAAAKARKHFYLEKPIASTTEDGRRVLQAAEAAGVTGVVGFNRRFDPPFEKARALLAAGSIGSVRAVLSTSASQPLPLACRSGSGNGRRVVAFFLISPPITWI